LGGLDPTPTVTPKCFTALEDTGPMEATNVRLRLARSESARPSRSATANRLQTCAALVNATALI
jgi:hypothetical protein